jgi:transcriptional regulator with XRE-family HTH domain
MPAMTGGWASIGPYELQPTEQLGLDVIGLLIRDGRRACGLSQRGLAARVGLNQSTISRLETGQLRGLRLKTLARIFGILHDPLLGEKRRSRSRWAA